MNLYKVKLETSMADINLYYVSDKPESCFPEINDEIKLRYSSNAKFKSIELVSDSNTLKVLNNGK